MIEPATTSDLSSLLALEKYLTPSWSEQSWQVELTGPDRLVPLARIDGAVVGAACFQAVGEVADLHRIVVAPQWRRQGIAAQLLSAGLDWARQRGVREVLLEVAHTNQAAIGLYRRFGFSQVAERCNYYGPGSDALMLAHRFDEREMG